jgi:hypothetical protein
LPVIRTGSWDYPTSSIRASSCLRASLPETSDLDRHEVREQDH